MNNVRIAEDTTAGDLSAFLVTWTLALEVGVLDTSAIAAALAETQAAAQGEGSPADAAVEAYKAALTRLGRNPNRYRISSDALLRRARKDGVPTILPLVDLNNILSIRSGLPIGCYDLAKVDGEIVHRQGREGEVMATLGKGDMDVFKLPLLADASGPFGSTVSDSVRCAITEATTAALFVMYGYGDADEAKLLAMVAEVCLQVGGRFGEAPRLIRA